MLRHLVAALLFIAFVPGVVVTLPSKGANKWTILALHTLLFMVASHFAMCCLSYEMFGNHGAVCPNGYKMQEDKSCVPIGQPTYSPGSIPDVPVKK
jgi:hypothetical protein